jgi:hypothetical protein
LGKETVLVYARLRRGGVLEGGYDDLIRRRDMKANEFA